MPDNKNFEDIKEEIKSNIRANAYREMRRARREEQRRKKEQGSPIPNLFWGLIFILSAIVIYLYSQDYVAADDIWKVFLTGLGGIFIVEGITYLFSSSYRSHAIGRMIPGIILSFVGLGFLLGFSNWWPIALIIAGVAIIAISWILQREIQTRRKTQETLRESEVKYRHIIDNANSIIMEMDTSGKIIFINKFALEFFGFDENDILGHDIIGTITAPMVSIEQDTQKMISDIIARPEDYLHFETENILKNGEKVWIIWTYKPIYDEDNNIKEILCTGIDRTQQKRAEELAAQQMKETAAAEERTRLARDLHDAVSQTLFSASMIADVLPKIWEKNQDEGKRRLEEVRQLTRGALAEMRTLLFELRPAALADAELGYLLRQLSESITGRTRIPVTVTVDGICNPPAEVKIALYRIAQEALNNVGKHSGATQSRIYMVCTADSITLNVSDNGKGFETDSVKPESLGMGIMRERAKKIGANVTIESKRGEGSNVTVLWEKDKENA